MSRYAVSRGISLVFVTMMLTGVLLWAPAVSAQDEEPTCTVAVGDAIKTRSSGGLLPLNDWVPLFYFTISTDADNPAYRELDRLTFDLHRYSKDGTIAGDTSTAPNVTDVLQFAIFQEQPMPGTDAPDQELNYVDAPILVWEGTGEPFDRNPGDLYYQLNFSSLDTVFIGCSAAQPEASYIVAFRTTASMQTRVSFQTTIYDINFAVRAPKDSYPPAESWPNTPDAYYWNSFSVFDSTGTVLKQTTVEDGNTFQYPYYEYTPVAEYTRPRWDAQGQLVDKVFGEFIEIRRLLSLDTWTALIGLNLHGVSPWTGDSNIHTVPDDVAIQEVNLVLTDIGGDPYGAPGSGGFNPRTMLERSTENVSNTIITEGFAVGVDFAFNGAWVYADTNNDGLFNPPTSTLTAGVNFNGDFPLFPGSLFFIGKSGADAKATPIDPFVDSWEYIPFPPGGGDPWWKIKLDVGGGRRRASPGTGLAGGYLEPVPDGPADFALCYRKADFFVTVRPDGGRRDASLYPGDGTAMAPGADFKAFIEPRRFNPTTGHQDGGILTDSMIPFFTSFNGYWQDDSRWGDNEPWFPQRTQNQDTTKPVRYGLDIHDLMMTYETNNRFATVSNINYMDNRRFPTGSGSMDSHQFENWMDPFGLRRDRFTYRNPAGVFRWTLYQWGGDSTSDDFFNTFQFAFETVPFRSVFDVPPVGPRSSYYPLPPLQPTLPDYSTWLPFQDPPSQLPTGRYPSLTDWPLSERKARLLRQHVDARSGPVAMLGINVCGTDDVVVNATNQSYLTQVSVAFWGPSFTPSSLLALDKEGLKQASGVLLYEDADGDGVFADTLGADRLVPLSNLAWRDAPEYVDITGDGEADDLSGDGVVNATDRAWVLTLTMKDRWRVPDSDYRTGEKSALGPRVPGDAEKRVVPSSVEPSYAEEAVVTPSKPAKPHWKNAPALVDAAQARALAEQVASSKALGTSGHQGDDLFLVVQTSDKLKRFEEFRAVVPAYLPQRTNAEERAAGLKFYPQVYVSPNVYAPAHPDEGPVQPFYYNDMLVANIPCEIVNLTGPGQKIARASDAVAVLGLDLSTNRGAEGVLASGTVGTAGDRSFIVSGTAWPSNSLKGCYLIDSGFEAYEIVGNTTNRLALLSGTPREGKWCVVKDPSFLEQVIVEFYDEGLDGRFSAAEDLLPLDKDQTKSGVALYRDNRNNPANRIGQFDPGIDIPLQLDDRPVFIGNVGEPEMQVKFVFSSPGTDSLPTSTVTQPRLRQYIPETFGQTTGDQNYGPEFFVVLRTSNSIEYGDDFRVGIVSWGPQTPSEPDPDTFTDPGPPNQAIDEFDIYSEFPWGARAIGIITCFKDAPDATGMKWIRSSVAKAKQTNVIAAEEVIPEPDDVVIASVSQDKVPTAVGAGGYAFSITGSGFGTAPRIVLGGVQLTVTSVQDGFVNVIIPASTAYVAGPLALAVTNTANGRSSTRTDLVRAVGTDMSDSPMVNSLSPARGGQADFPITIYGSNFASPEVYFSETTMPVVSWTSTQIIVAFPTSGLAVTGTQNVTVRNASTGLSDVKVNAFTYVNAPVQDKVCFIATAAYGTSSEGELGALREFRDTVLLKSALGTAFVNAYYRTSPPIADFVGTHSWAAALVRGVLTPLVWALGHGTLIFAAGALVFVAGLGLKRRQRG